MKNKTILAICVALGTAANVAHAKDQNKICFDNVTSISSINLNSGSPDSIDENDISVSNINALSGIDNCITIEVDRKNSTSNVDFVKNSFDTLGISWDPMNMAATTSNSTTPEELNFAVSLNFSFTYWYNSYTPGHHYSCANVFLGQGHFNFTNNWWIFRNVGNEITTNPDYFIQCKDTDLNGTTAYFKASGGSSSSEFALYLLK